MLLKGSSVIENIDESNLSRELEIAKFRNYSRENFSDLIPHNINFEDFIENTTKFYSISLPKELREYFIRIDSSPYYPLSNAPVFKKIEELLYKSKNDSNFVSNYREVKKYYYKWLIQKTPKEKQFYSSSLSNTIERNFSYQNFFNIFLYAVVISNDHTFYNPNKAIELFYKVTEIISASSLPNDLANEIFYLINIYKGFVYIKEYEFAKALESYR